MHVTDAPSSGDNEDGKDLTEDTAVGALRGQRRAGSVRGLRLKSGPVTARESVKQEATVTEVQ